MRHTKVLFKLYFIGIGIVLFILFCTYRYVFNGNLSSEVSDWTAFVTIFNGVGTLLLTALNVWIVYKLTITIAEKEEQHRLFDKQKELIHKTFGCSWFIYNYFLNECKQSGYQKAFDMCNKLKELEIDYPFFKEVDSCS